MSDSLYMHAIPETNVHVLFLGDRQRIWAEDGTFVGAPFCEAAKIATQAGAQPNKVCLFQAVSNTQQPGFCDILSWQATESGRWLTCDGIVVGDEPGTATIFQTADCPAVTIHNRATGETIFYHCGRPAGMPIDNKNIITDALEQIAPANDVTELEVVIMGSISGERFEHQDGPARKQAEAYLKRYGPDVFADVDRLALDMIEVIRHEHLAAGMTDQQITHFGPACTYDAPCCASHREHLVTSKRRTTANTCVLITT